MQRLKKIKLTNFKSFADSTQIPITKRLTAIVGPNGCGKSNVVDAIRWVIGESSAKQLRGQSMSDVIFNGTSQRKPVGKASVELVFDNSDKWVSGDFARFDTIEVKREVERDGQSSYYINSTPCRRRDILDVFLGTGLGSKSYAIIEQGMISRLVEAKPEEMRAHLEEVAGISKYKERRRDTENRMRRTVENLERVNDIREELATQLRRLKRQANAAERYKVLKAEEQEVNSQIKALMWKGLEDQRSKQSLLISQSSTQYDEQLSLQRQVESDIEVVRQRELDSREVEAEVQKRFYTKASDIARLEEQIKNIQQQTQSWQAELDETNLLLQEVSDSASEQQSQVATVNVELNELSPQKQELLASLNKATNELTALEDERRVWQLSWDEFQKQFNQDSKHHESAKTSLVHLGKQVEQVTGRLQQMQANKDSAPIDVLEEKIEPLRLQVQDAQDHIASLQQDIDQKSEKLQQQRQQHQQINNTVKDLQRQVQAQQAKLSSLEALQQAAFDDEVSESWLQSKGLDTAARLGANLRVESGWELAVETVLSKQFNAVCLPSLDSMQGDILAIDKGEFLFVEQAVQASSQEDTSARLLINQVSSEWDLSPWLNGVFAVETLEQAWELRRTLSVTQSVVTRDGVWMGANWIRITRSVDNENSVLLRKQEIESCELKCTELQHDLNAEESRLLQSEQSLLSIEDERDDQHDRFKNASKELVELQSQFSSQQSRLNELKTQQDRLLTEIDQATQLRSDLVTQHDDTDVELRRLSSVMVDSELKRTEFLQQRDQYQAQLSILRENKSQSQKEVDLIGSRARALQEQLELLTQTLSRQSRQQQQLQERHNSLTEHLENNNESPLSGLQQTMQTELELHVSLEKEVQESEQSTRKLSFELSQLEKKRAGLLRLISDIKDKKQQLEMKSQELVVRQATLVEQLESMDLVMESVLSILPEEANLTSWEERSASLAKRIGNLGSINIGAIEEYEVLRERKEYLDAQCLDLEQALETLNDAIKKIDKETRVRFKDTFEKVNSGFKELFPKIFGGGAAYLELEENDLLNSGVLLKAQPPGKRNSTIQMLSGGEKALTAIALVFALFRLNPSPFCILDEVDAPLDDVNVGRFCNLVKEMSAMTQFLIISHNKVSIAMAEHLMGVTMHEAGVSRIVSVDVEAAIEMAEA